MAKGTLEFNLDEENKDFLRASRATDLALVIWDMDQYLRSIYNAKIEMPTDEQLMEKWIEIKDKYDIIIDSLIE